MCVWCMCEPQVYPAPLMCPTPHPMCVKTCSCRHFKNNTSTPTNTLHKLLVIGPHQTQVACLRCDEIQKTHPGIPTSIVVTIRLFPPNTDSSVCTSVAVISHQLLKMVSHLGGGYGVDKAGLLEPRGAHSDAHLPARVDHLMYHLTREIFIIITWWVLLEVHVNIVLERFDLDTHTHTHS